MKTSTHAAGNMLDLDAAFGSLEYSEPAPVKPAAPQRFETGSSGSKAVELETYQPPGMPAGLRAGPGYKSEDEAAMKVRLEQKEKAAEAEMMKRIKAKEMQMMQQQLKMQQQQQQLMQQQPMQQPMQPQRFQADAMTAEAVKRVQQQEQMMRRPESAGALAPPPPAALGPLTSTPSTGVREVRSAGAFSRFSKSLTAEKGSCTWTYVLLGLAFVFIGAIIAVAVCSAKKNAAAPAVVAFTQPAQTSILPKTVTGGGASITYDLL